MNEPRSTSAPPDDVPASDASRDADRVPDAPDQGVIADAGSEGAPSATTPDKGGGGKATSSPRPRDLTLVAVVATFAAACVAALAAYAAINGASLRASGEPKAYGIEKLTVPRGTATRDGDTLVAKAPAADVLIIATQTDFRARDLAAVTWDAVDIPPGADVRLLFSSDYRPRTVQNRVLAVEDGRVQSITMTGDPDWLGRITGLALAVRAPGATIRVRGVAVKPQSASQLLGDRAREWFRFEPWNGTSINSITGGAQAQTLPLPVPVSAAALIALAVLALLRRFLPARLPATLASLAAGVFIVAWAVLDLRWTVNLARQNAQTLERYAGKDAAGRTLAAEDGDLVRFIEKAKAAMPADPQRVYVLASAHYYRGRAGWHLLPHRAMWFPAVDVAPPAGALAAGDYLVVWHDGHVRFDAAGGRLHFDNGVDLAARLVLADGDRAVYAIL